MREPSAFRNLDKRQILPLGTIHALSGTAAFLVLKHLWLSSGWSEVAVIILALAWAAPAYLLLYRHVSILPSLAVNHPNNEAELQLLRTVIDSLPDRIYVKDRQSKFILTNRSLREFSSGSPDADILGQDDFNFFPHPVAARFLKDEASIMATGEPVVHSGWDKDINGNHVWTLTTKVPYRDQDGSITGLIGIGRDLTSQKKLEDSLIHAHEEMRYKATHDTLTSLLNRGMILDLLERELRRTRREHTSIALLLIDVDNFKLVNDTLGHQVGDEVLRHVARRLTEAVRSYDFVGRYGGEEFLLVLSNCERCSPLDRAEEVRESICRVPITTSRGDLPITISIGVLASSDWPSKSTEEMLHQVDSALYAAKAAGRNCCHLASSQPISASATHNPQRSKGCDQSCRAGLQPKESIVLTL